MMADFVTVYENDQSISRRCLSMTNCVPDDASRPDSFIHRDFISDISSMRATCLPIIVKFAH